ncbi:DUF6399 domain-containing protein [Acaryochloris marina]|uniref:DUF6399 domain-containing protein n=1 Tax=Acaryochloris marina TaxID=155978 RepID=UPI002016F023|nr:DUF6399 domain-containing protein [Acaryochloris marina]
MATANGQNSASSTQGRLSKGDGTSLCPVTQAPHDSTMNSQESQEWVDWAQWMSTKYQRTSSAVEGRNGYLSRLHHAARGFSEESLKVLTIIHNFDLKRADGTTAAQRLFGHPFPDVFESVVNSMGNASGTSVLNEKTA